MVHVNYVHTEMTLKLVYYGPGLCGKTTNLKYIFDHIAPEKRGKMVSLATESDRTLFFDLLPLELGKLHGFKVRLQLFTVPGQVKYNATRKLVLKGVDGLVFVADSQADMLASNLESQTNLRENLQEEHLDLDQLPLVIQYNKRDLPNLLPLEQLERQLNPRGLPSFAASAITGQNVLETLREISKLTLNHVRRQLEYREEPEEIERPATRGAAPPPPARPAPAPASMPHPGPPPSRLSAAELDQAVSAMPSAELDELRSLQQQLQEQLTSLQPEEPSPPPTAQAAGAPAPAVSALASDLDQLRQELTSLRREFEGRFGLQAAAHSKLQEDLSQLKSHAGPHGAAGVAELRAGLGAVSEQCQTQALRSADLASAVEALRGELDRLSQRQAELERRQLEGATPRHQPAASAEPAGSPALEKRCAELETAVASIRAELSSLASVAPDLGAIQIEDEEESEPAEEESGSGEVESFWKRLFKESG